VWKLLTLCLVVSTVSTCLLSCPLAIGGLPGFVRLMLGAWQIYSESSSGCKFERRTIIARTEHDILWSETDASREP
jgi:hypothetical protein